jgi:hypothetical protein
VKLGPGVPPAAKTPAGIGMLPWREGKTVRPVAVSVAVWAPVVTPPPGRSVAPWAESTFVLSLISRIPKVSSNRVSAACSGADSASPPDVTITAWYFARPFA